VRQYYSGEVGEFLIIWCEIFRWFCTPKIIKIGSFFAALFKIQGGGWGQFWDTIYVPTQFAVISQFVELQNITPAELKCRLCVNISIIVSSIRSSIAASIQRDATGSQ